MPFYVTMEMLRGLCALLVLMLHMNRMVSQDSPNTLGSWIDVGGMGVDYFFVLSGFLIYHLNSRNLGCPEKGKIYYIKRAARVYPMFWLALAFSMILLPFSQSLSLPPLIDLIKHVFLITPHINASGEGRVLGVVWTLELDMIFYACFGLLFFIKSRVLRRISFAIGLVASCFYPYFLLCYFGMFTAYISGRTTFHVPAIFLLIGATVATWVEFANPSLILFEKFVFGVSFSLMLLSLVSLERRCPEMVARLPALFRWSGKYSYSVYLFHIPVGLILYALIKRAGLTVDLPGWLIVTMLSAITWAVTMYISAKIEHPMNKFIQRWINQRFSVASVPEGSIPQKSR